jgi:hypothetical protein
MNMHRALVLCLIGFAIGAAALVILNIWGVDLGDLLWKLLATMGVLALLAGFLLVVRSDFGEHKRLKDNDFID